MAAQGQPKQEYALSIKHLSMPLKSTEFVAKADDAAQDHLLL